MNNIEEFKITFKEFSPLDLPKDLTNQVYKTIEEYTNEFKTCIGEDLYQNQSTDLNSSKITP